MRRSHGHRNQLPQRLILPLAIPMKTVLLTILALCTLQGCMMSPNSHSIPPVPQAGWEAGIGRPGAVLYGRDGAPVGAGTVQANSQNAGQASVAEPTVSPTEQMPHRPEESGGSRPVLLELYQDVVAEREELAIQLEITQKAMRDTEDRNKDLETRLTEEITSREQSEATRKEAEGHMYEMGRRLAVAQMRRLEAEKLLLEKTLAERRKLAESSQ